MIAYKKVIFPLDITYNRIIHFIPGHLDRLTVDNARQGYNRHVGSAAAYIHHHVSKRLRDRKSGAYCRRNRLLNKVDLPSARK